MTRSQESLKRRAAKRSVSLPEQKAKDWPSSKKSKSSGSNSVGQSSHHSISTGLRHSAVTKPPIKSDWKCEKCNNINFMTRDSCNRCGVLRLLKAQSKESVVKKQETTSSVVIKKKATIKCDKNSSEWPDLPSEEKLAENQRLRQLLLAEVESDTPSSLTDEERERARILLQRSERKKKKKEAILAWRHRGVKGGTKGGTKTSKQPEKSSTTLQPTTCTSDIP